MADQNSGRPAATGRKWRYRRQAKRPLAYNQVYYEDLASPTSPAQPPSPASVGAVRPGPPPKRKPKTPAAWRAWQLAGLTLAALTLAGYAVMSQSGGAARRVLASLPGQPPHLTLLLAGRDIVYCAPYTPCKDQDTRKVWQPPNTDSIMLVKVDGTRVNVLSIPRDTNVGPFDPRKGVASQKVNSQYWSGGLDGLSSAVEQITGERVDYAVVVRTDYVERVIGALGGLDVTVPDVPSYGDPKKRGIQFDDNAANLHVHLSPGPHHLDGAQAVAYLRMRKGLGDDYGRMDHQKQALNQLISRLKTPAGLAAALPVILGGLGNGVDTNADAGLVENLTPFLSQFRMNFATMPTTEIKGTFNLAVDPLALSKLWGSEGDVTSGSSVNTGVSVRVMDASGKALGPRFIRALEQAGYAKVSLETTTASREHTQVFTQTEVSAAESLADLLNVSRLQGIRFPIQSGEVGVLLGEDASSMYAALPQ
ncbi:LCP family protein [Deinococcus ruber]|uniref:LytR family transcriptional regulator n=1 Tax=Deinococcus ruber TaxID=1848197 RepID=A0A918F3H3_9DEIO|nr:LCP family protein [Deinococcus ruber]GGR04935.1 LytR family transcriptional regulator [Deinococcus ruber]